MNALHDSLSAAWNWLTLTVVWMAAWQLCGFVLAGAVIGFALSRQWLGAPCRVSLRWLLREARTDRDTARQLRDEAATLLTRVQAIADGIETRAQSARDEAERQAAVAAREKVERLLFGEDV